MMVDMVQPTKEDTICDPQQGRIPSFSRWIHTRETSWLVSWKPFRTLAWYVYRGLGLTVPCCVLAMNLQLHGIENPYPYRQRFLASNGRKENSSHLCNPPFKGGLDYDSVESSNKNGEV
jgi:type I restriction enzyme M protein